MKNFFESLKDFLYDSIDYIIVLSIVGIVVVVIGWRIDLLFANDALGVIEANNGQEVHNDLNKDDYKEPILNNVENQNNLENTSNNKDTVIQEDTIIKISIPDGSLPSKIGSILEDSGLIANKSDFITKSQELKLDTKLKSGNYDISTSSSLEDIIYLISK